ncbi:T9SS type B sorting domain-containing protein [Flavobacterium cellulosilyticum]|uniref:T9SS type B sorting domain-containing protein n=1 Tax=Flavobacterium cellulosilyticum TaxID=2541731 RepID=A0A4R5CIQ2_9FLAO|nr:T9SS type B sorting domain-containing protein [Flavobacterium cellulosilyticum]TDD99675.1 T9SS type B sorting domain-containing protein [Flavobacterium cellulosilyticum]
MKKTIFSRTTLVVLLLLLGVISYGQNFVPFTPRYDKTLKGDILLIGNNILSKDATSNYNTTGQANNQIDPMVNVDIDTDPTTFNSSSADMAIPNPGCFKIVYAGLYWSAVVKGSEPITTIKLKTPGAAAYLPITGTQIYFQNAANNNNSNSYACYADVTALVTSLSNPQGTFTVANVSSLTGNKPNAEGLSAGWSLFVVYEDPTLPSKYITSFDGYSRIDQNNPQNISVSGFKTIPVGPVRAKYAFSAIEGDNPYTGDFLQINGAVISAINGAGTVIRPPNNFFNSSVSYINSLTNTPELFTTRNPASINTLGFDAGILSIPNAGNTVIKNGDTSATIRLGSSLDIYYFYFNAFAVDVIEPKIVLTKTVWDNSGANIGNQNVVLGQQLNYVIGLQNKGNDNATSLTIRDRLPINVIFNYPADIVNLPAGVTVSSYNPATRDINFNISNSIVKVGDALKEIRFKVQVVPLCNMLSDACSNIIDNIAYATYKGSINTSFTISDDPSFDVNTGCLLVPKATNFLVDIDNCLFTKNEVLCGASVDIKAANGYDSYSWSSSPTGTPVIGTNQTLTVTNPGKYYVHNTAIAPCLSINQVVTVTTFGGTLTNPVIPFADEVVTCPNDGKKLPNIFLCGANAFRDIKTGISDGSVIVWEKLNEASCTAVVNIDCANESNSCTWSQVGSGPNYQANASGQYRVTLNYPGGCFNRYYFNVYQNLLNPTAVTNDIICNTPGKITVGGVPSGYEYSLKAAGPWQSSNVFAINGPNSYTVYLKQTGNAQNLCVFSVPNILIRKRDFTVTPVITQPFCHGDKGNITLQINDVQPQYFVTVKQAGVTIFSSGPDSSNTYHFNNLNPGQYDYTISTDDGCTTNLSATIVEPAVIKATSALTKPLTCTDGEITVTPTGGTPPYSYFVNSTTVFQGTPQIIVTNPLPPGGIYTIKVVDSNNCETTTSITVSATMPPAFSIAKTDVLCAGTNTGVITINVSNANGNTLRYSIDNGVTFINSNVFSGLAAGNYAVVVESTLAGDVCLSAPQTITIIPTSPITGTATLTTPYTCGGTATITASASGGTAPYSYSIDGVTFQTNTVFSGLYAGTYSITIKDSKNCTYTINPSIVVSALKAPTDLTITATDLICPENVSHVNIAGVDGISPLRYRIISAPSTYAVTTVPSPYNADGEFKYLPGGVYVFEVKDRNDCIYQETYNLVPIPPISVTGTLINNVKCYNSATGAIKFDVSGNFTGGSKVYSYSISGPISSSAINQTAPTILLNNLLAGTYTITVTDKKTGCTDSASVTINQSAAALVLGTTVSPIKCSSNGSVVANATGGWGGNTFTLSQPDATIIGPQASTTFVNLTQIGSYKVTVTDTNGCSVTDTFTLAASTTPTISIAGSDLCYDTTNQATIIVTTSGGVSPYQYSINNGTSYQTSTTFSNLIPGNYTALVKDAFGCISTALPLTIAPQLIVKTVLTKDLDCSASPDALITGTITGGTSGFKYAVSINGGVYSAPVAVVGNTFTYSVSSSSVVASTTYQFQVTDLNNCPAQSGIITIKPILVYPSASVSTVSPTCNGSSNGSVTLGASLGVAPYTYSFNGSPFTSTTLYTGLSAGVAYYYQVKDSKECVSPMGSITLTQPIAITGSTAITTPYTCTGNGVITVTASGGKAPYSYSIDGVTFQAGNTFSGLTNGSYVFTIKDASNCTQVLPTVIIEALTPPKDLAFAASSLTCPSNTSNVTITTTGGALPLTYQIVSPIAGVSQGSNVFNGLAPGSYAFQVTDSKECTYQEFYIIKALAPITVKGVVVNNVKCFGSSTASVNYTVSGTTAYSYRINLATWITGQTASSINLTNLAAGVYSIEIKDDATTCTGTTSVTVQSPTAALTVTTTVTPIKCGSNGNVTVNATGGWGGNSYTLTLPDATIIGPQASTTFANLTQIGTYTATVMDSNGCIVSSNFTLTTPIAPTASIVGSDLCYDTSNQATIIVTASGGVSPYQYSINNGTSYQASTTFSNLTPGNYTILVKDSFGCTSTAFAQNIATQLNVNTVLTKDLDCSASPDAVITGTIAGGTSGFNYSVSINGGAYSAPVSVVGNIFAYSVTASSVVAATTYQFQVTDINNCPATSGIITIKPISIPAITAVNQTQQIYCNSDTTAAINVVINSAVGTAPYVINVLNTTTGTNYGTQTSGLAAGNYTITITDAKLCTDTKLIIINEPVALTSSVTYTDITCTGTGTSLGSITGTPSGGVSLYTYTLTNNVGAVVGPPTIVAGSYTFDIINFGVYELSFTDANSCTVKKTINIASPPKDLLINTTSGPASCTTASVVVSVNPFIIGGPYHFALFPINSGFTPPYEYATNTGSYQNADAGFPLQATFSGLNPGVIYSFIVYDEATNCYYFKQATSPTQTASTLTSTVSPKNVTCKGANNGTIDFTFTNTYPALTNVSYEVFNSQTNLTTGINGTVSVLTGGPVTSTVTGIGPLALGTYYLLFKEISGGANNGCTNASETFTITESAVALSVSASVIKTENCNAPGQISVLGQGGTPSYTYQVVVSTDPIPTALTPGWVASNTFNLAAGSYSAYVKDANACIIGTPISVLLDPSPVIVATVNNQCTATEGNFAIDVTLPTAGIAPYSFSIDGGVFQTKAVPFTIANVSSGVHTIEVKDFNGCGNLVSVPVLAPLGMTSAITALPTCATNDGVITVNTTGGSGTYNYSIAPNPASITLAGNVFSGVPAGTYTVTITDISSTCTKSVPVTLSAPTPVTFSTTNTDVSCAGGSNGSITVDLPISNDNPPYTYEITAPIIVAAQNSNIFTGLAAGTYTVKVNSGRGCSAINNSIVVGQPLALAVDASSAASPFGCAVDNTVKTATVTINTKVGTGTAPYTYSIDGTNYFTTNTFTINDNGTSYNLTVFIKDANGCLATGSIPITTLPKITAANATVNAAIDCNNTGSLIVNVAGGSGNFTYQMLPSSSAQLSNVFAVSTPGDYYFRVNDVTTACYFDTAAFTVAPFNTINVVAAATAPVTCFGDANGAISINVTGYLGAYSYEVFNNLGASVKGPIVANTTTNPQSISGLLAGNYTVVVKETVSPFCTKTSNVVTVGSPSSSVSLSFLTVNDNCNVNAGQIVAEAKGGTTPYLFQILPASIAAPLVISPGWTNTNTLNAESGDYVIYVKDANDCTQSLPVAIGLDPTPVIAVSITSANQCSATEGNFAINVTVPAAGIAPYSFSIDGGVFQNQTVPFTVSNLSSGVHTVEGKDVNGCGNQASVTIQPPLGLTPVITALPTCATNDGVITVNANGGAGTYTYFIAPHLGSITLIGNVFSNVPAGNYTVFILDATTTCTKSAAVTLSAPTPVTFSTAVKDVSCNGNNDGIITVSLLPGNDNPTYTYEITAPIVVAAQNSNIFTGLAAGTYTVKVNSGRGCSTSNNSVIVNQPTLLTVDASSSFSQFGCRVNNTASTATVTINATIGTGTAPYSYSIDGTNYFTTNTFSIVDNGTAYNLPIYIKDLNGCSASSTIAITPLPKITVSAVAIVTPIDCKNTGSIAITVSGGSGNFSYQMLPNGLPQASNIFNVINPGSYYFRVTDTTTTCYFDTAEFVVTPFDTIDVIATATTPLTCFGDSNGALEINVSGYTGAYTYQVLDRTSAVVTSGSGNTTTNPQLISGLTGGNYTVVVSESNSPFCKMSSNTVTINSPALPLTVIATETSSVSCSNNQGTINAVGTGGWGSLQYELVGPINVPYSTNNLFTNLSAGSYSVNVKDSKGCITSSAPVILSLPTPIAITASSSTPLLLCYGDKNATITVTNTTGGQGGNYSYILNTTSATPPTSSGPQSSTVFAGLGVGTYTVTAIDGWNCSQVSTPITIAQPTEIIASLTLASSQTCLNKATLKLSASGGTGTYVYSADGIAYNPTNFATSITIPVAPGIYHYYVKDANGCTSVISNDIEIVPMPILTINLDLSNAKINCYGDNTGVIVAKAEGGLGNYVYSLLDANGVAVSPAPMQSSPGVFVQLTVGTYKVHVVSGDCNKTTASITINQPTLPLVAPYVTTDVSCSGASNGQIVINASGGTGIIKYAISPNLDQFFDTNTFKDLSPNNYSVIVQDVLGCYLTFNFQIDEPLPLQATLISGSIFPEVCSGDNDGEFSIEISGGTSSYKVSLDKQNGPFVSGAIGQTDFTFKNLKGGTHIVYILDAMSCSTNLTVVLPDPVSLKPVAIVEYDCLNNLPTNSVTVKVDSSILPADVDYALDGIAPFQTSNLFTNVPSGSHFISARHTNGCIQKTQNFTILQINTLAVILNNGGLNEIVATTTGGSGSYHYTFNGTSTGTSNTYIYYSTGDYTVEVVDSEGCTAKDTKVFTFIDINIPNVFTPDGDGNNDTWGPTNTANYPDILYHIYDRYGRIVGTYHRDQFWDGKYNGFELPSGDYWYTLRLNNDKDGREFVGHFTLYR